MPGREPGRTHLATSCCETFPTPRRPPGVPRQRSPGSAVASDQSHELGVERGEASIARATLLSPQPALLPRAASSSDDTRSTRGSAAASRTPVARRLLNDKDALEMFGKGRTASSCTGVSLPSASPATPTARRQPRCATPLIEDVEDIRFAEVDLHRTSARALAIVAIEIAIDSSHGDLQRHAVRRPARHDLERWPDDPDQVAVVLATQVGFDRRGSNQTDPLSRLTI